MALRLPGSGDEGKGGKGSGAGVVGVTSFWLCGQSKRPHQSSPTSTSHNLPLLFPSVSVPGGVISHISPERKLDERGHQDGVEVHRLFFFFLESSGSGILCTQREGKKGRVTGPRSEGEGRQAGGSVGVQR